MAPKPTAARKAAKNADQQVEKRVAAAKKAAATRLARLTAQAQATEVTPEAARVRDTPDLPAAEGDTFELSNGQEIEPAAEGETFELSSGQEVEATQLESQVSLQAPAEVPPADRMPSVDEDEQAQPAGEAGQAEIGEDGAAVAHADRGFPDNQLGLELPSASPAVSPGLMQDIEQEIGSMGTVSKEAQGMLDVKAKASKLAASDQDQVDSEGTTLVPSGSASLHEAPDPACVPGLHKIKVGQKTMTGQSADGVKVRPNAPLCTCCGYPCDPLKAVLKTKATEMHHAKFTCKCCNSVQTMVNRNLKPGAMDKLSEEKKAEFFRAASKTADGGRFKYSLVRGVFKQMLTTQTVEEHKKQVKSEFLPLAVWEKRGFDSQLILAYDHYEWNPAAGWCYACPIKTVSWSVAEQEVETYIMNAERTLSKRKRAEGDSEAKADVEDLEMEEDDVAPTPAPKAAVTLEETPAQKKARHKTESQAAKAEQMKSQQAERKLEKEIKQHNSKMQILASRAITVLSMPCDNLCKAMKADGYAILPDFIKQKVEKTKEAACGNLQEAEGIMKKVKMAAKKNERMSDLSFTASDLAQLVKNIGENMKWLTDMEKLAKHA